MPSQHFSRASPSEGFSIARQVMEDAVTFYLENSGPAVARAHVEKLADNLKFYDDSYEAYREALERIRLAEEAERLQAEKHRRQQMQELMQSVMGVIQTGQPETDLPLTVAERIKHALDCLENEHLMVHKYDYAWIMRYINEHHLKELNLFFFSVNSFRDYLLVQMDQKRVASKSTLSEYSNYVNGRFPDWTFSDTNDSSECTRRTNIVRRFTAVFVKGR